ncbi:kinase-like protein, partial [Amniculicola lignicola CBS 123094]
QFLGLLLHPVAVCDLATFMEDFEAIDFDDKCNRYLYSQIGCIVAAVEYLHIQSIRHKDLKPSNILLSPNRLWLTDFGSATDFSMLSVSATENGERGTPKYFAPEVATFSPNGRAADIFSLGCILLEICTL